MIPLCFLGYYGLIKNHSNRMKIFFHSSQRVVCDLVGFGEGYITAKGRAVAGLALYLYSIDVYRRVVEKIVDAVS